MVTSVLILDPPEHSVDDLGAAIRRVAPQAEVTLVNAAEQLLAELLEPAEGQLVILHGDRGDGIQSGFALIQQIRGVSPDTPIVIVADKGDVDSAAAAISAGANDFLVRGPNLNARVTTLLGKMRGLFEALDRARQLRMQTSQLQDAIQARCRIVGESPQVVQLIQRIHSVAKVPRPVLVLGERGTGKEMVARAIHFAGKNPTGPIVTVNCAAFSDALLESELFGHEKGAFTGADESRNGKFAQADTGTLFLDEIGHMSLAFQRKILRVVEYGTFTRVGGHREQRVNTRIIAATNVQLGEKIKSGEFLNDLYDRLAFDVIEVPPLRQREGDLEVLARHFLDQFALEIPDFAGKTLSAPALRVLRRYAFPGNVRELKNIIERAAYRDTTNEITPEDLGLLSENELDLLEGSFRQRVDAFQRHLIEDAMNKAGGNQAEAARQLRLSYHQFRYYYGKLAAKGMSQK